MAARDMTRRHGIDLTYYDLGRTPFFACQADQRFSYCLYVPEDYDERGAKRYDLVVLVHGTDRTAGEYRDRFAAYCDEHDCIALAPLFPAGIGEPGELHDYKFIDYGGIRFDRILLSMVDEVAAKYRLSGPRMKLHGFSGGGQFAHRFLYLHPGRLSAVSIGAPGLVTLLDPRWPWWAGIGDFGQRLGAELDLGAMRGVAVQMIIGDEDTDTWEITVTEKDALWVEGADAAGATRLDRLESLRRSFEQAGVPVRLDVVPGAAHNGFAVLDTVRDFFGRVKD
ncbi:hypothetical protein [Nonomuraea africana]|uniref:Pimeloyl-ACP methyl ester carboxylesterase n=1 Tax=Nonomuraea africana TaxID=46171 RepID=A0ABR9KBX5_9ACTN|nr:hypothetical protein [Nonomuraea africana]MBE1559335.1 pimeloyl-ACP methyl ester carboxylesterase [Nonomuraea africana]